MQSGCSVIWCGAGEVQERCSADLVFDGVSCQPTNQPKRGYDGPTRSVPSQNRERERERERRGRQTGRHTQRESERVGNVEGSVNGGMPPFSMAS